ncbi:OLC1v1029102C1 [Oldenlandia corymbosa var. corymbosa]|uniref:OLC1v1029102C1 n=1 Tax=Oldenlandia corymbosa var. corymbosa TaxID=529605 RepID=A0AAV1CDJ7_OLDCO|nr:OLC1v1029102C1 [Oldenlandia corymbosa var. corymbosa]
MEHLLRDGREQFLDPEFCKKLARAFNSSKGRTGKPAVKWTEVQNWFQNNQQQQTDLPKDAPAEPVTKGPPVSEAVEDSKMPKDKKDSDRRKLEFEAQSASDGAWYDIEEFMGHRFLDSGDAEVRVRYVGFGPDEDEWVNVMKAVRIRSITLEDSECHKVKVGDIALCFQERKDIARYFEAEIIEIQRRVHDMRGCRCLFTIRYTHDNMEEKVRLRRLCFRPNILAGSQETVKK